MFTRKNDNGTTLIETLIAVLLFSLISGVVSLFLINSYKNIAWFRERIAGESQLMLFRRITAAETSRIKIPYWVLPMEYEYSDESISIPWYGGDPEAFLEISQEEGFLSVKGPETSFRFDQLSIASLKHSISDNNNILEISLSCREETVPLLFRFSGFGLSSE